MSHRKRELERLVRDLRALAENNKRWANTAEKCEMPYDGPESYAEICHGCKAVAYERAAEWLEEILRA